LMGFAFAAADRPLRRILAIGCHSDDIEIGCGGTLLALTRDNPGLHVAWVVLTGSGPRAEEARASAEAFLVDAGSCDVSVHDFRESYLPYDGARVKAVFESLKAVEPDLIFTHARHDLHQDHRLACELTWNTFRDHVILEYEVPKFDGDLAVPNAYVPIDAGVVEQKIELLLRHFPSQAGRHWFDEELFRGILRLRGMEAAVQYAEAFFFRKIRLSSNPTPQARS
jgi:LmbE family N-acetylglucosaminyl deacetylase